jgi:hypothetical protein
MLHTPPTRGRGGPNNGNHLAHWPDFAVIAKSSTLPLASCSAQLAKALSRGSPSPGRPRSGDLFVARGGSSSAFGGARRSPSSRNRRGGPEGIERRLPATPWHTTSKLIQQVSTRGPRGTRPDAPVSR